MKIKSIFILSLAAFGTFCCIAALAGSGGIEQKEQGTEATPLSSRISALVSEVSSSDTTTKTEEPDETLRELGFTVPVTARETQNTRFLELVNSAYAYNGETSDSLMVDAWPTVSVSTVDVTVHEQVLRSVREMFNEGMELFNCTFYIASGYRTHQDQQRIYDNAFDKSYAALPNHSEHHLGLAADIFIIGIGQDEMEEMPNEVQWLSDNAWKYGLIQRYKREKKDITGVPDEPWHFRYIGEIHAWYCYKNNLCLEEYIDFLKDSGGYQATMDGEKYTVTYQIPQAGIIFVPENGSYEVSSDNTGGYVVTQLFVGGEGA